MEVDKIKILTQKIVTFRDARDWKQFHKPKDVALSLALEAAEVMEHFQWKSEEEIEDHIKKHREDLGDELADVLYWVLLMCYDFGIDIFEALESKMRKNEEKYPVEKARGRHTKYDQL